MGSDPTDDYYALLGIDATVDDAELRRVWRRLALRWHPDHAGPDTTHIFQKLLAVYAVLSDPTSRAAYDRSRAPSADPRRRTPGVLLTRLSRPLNILLACGSARHADDDVIELLLDDDEAAEGGMVTISMRVPAYCPACAPDAAGACAECGMTRTVEELFSAWLAIPPEVADGAILTPSVMLRGIVRPVSFRVIRDRRRSGGSS